MPRSETANRVHDAIVAIHSEVDRRAAVLGAHHADRLQCRRGCHACCVDDIAVSAGEAERIRSECAGVLEQAPHPTGACAFLAGDGSCRIYDQRPYVCRSEGLPLRWFEPGDSGAVVERRDICPLNGEGTPIERLGDEECWLLGPFEEQLRVASGSGRKVRLRDLFATSRTPAD